MLGAWPVNTPLGKTPGMQHKGVGGSGAQLTPLGGDRLIELKSCLGGTPERNRSASSQVSQQQGLLLFHVVKFN